MSVLQQHKNYNLYALIMQKPCAIGISDKKK